MLVSSLVRMLHILVLCRALLAAEVLTLSIDSHLGTSVEDCFERISIGEQLPSSAIYRNVSELTTRECEQICKQDKQCQAYDYGVGAKGNATCNLSNVSEKELKEKDLLIKNPDYDVYVRRIQCEQSPPSPLIPQLNDPNDPGNGPTHRPIFRPDVDEPKRPLDDYPSYDLKPYETSRPVYQSYQYTNHIDDRPDDYGSFRPDFDRPPSYGLHKPQEVSFRPERPYRKPSYDVLHFQGHYSKPQSWRPDPVYPVQPSDNIPDIYGPKPVKRPEPYLPEKPQYEYATRPPRPKPTYDYNRPQPDDPTKPDPYGPGPIGPPSPVYPKPTYDYQSQYASGYGQNQYQDNSIYLEIYDPPRPQRPSGAYFGYGSQSYPSQSHYGSSITQLDNYNRPVQETSGYRPSKPSYGASSSSSGYGGQVDDHYHIPSQETSTYRPPKPIYSSSSQNSGYGGQFQDNYRPLKPSYGTEIQSSGYGGQDYQRPIQETSTYRPSKPSYSTGSQSSGYGGHAQDNYRPQKPSYGSESQSSGYGGQVDHHFHQETSTYRPVKPAYGSSTQSPSYGGSLDYIPSQETIIYRPQKPLYTSGTQTSSYGGSDQNYGSIPSYGLQSKPSGYHKPSYSTPKPIQGSYGQVSQESYGSSLGNSQSSYGSSHPTYGNLESQYSPGYGNQIHDKPSYPRPIYDRPKPIRPSYDMSKPDDNRPDGDYGTYGDIGPSYGDHKPPAIQPVYDRPRPSYDRPRPTYDRPRPTYDGSSYDDKKPLPNETDGYGNVNIKPVYEYDFEKPSNVPSYVVRPSGEVVTSKPVVIGEYGGSSQDLPGYGRDPGKGVSYAENDPTLEDAEDRAKWRRLSRKANPGTRPGKR